MTNTVKNADVCRLLFSDVGDNVYKCEYCGTQRKQLPSSGYGNLISHLKDKHAEVYLADYLAYERSSAATLTQFGFASEKVTNIFCWMEWVIERNMPLAEVDNPLTRQMSKLAPISSKTLKKYFSPCIVTTGCSSNRFWQLHRWKRVIKLPNHIAATW